MNLSHSGAQAATARRRILVIDDEVEWRRTLAAELREGFDITIVSSAEEARYAIREARFEALVLDTELAGEDPSAFYLWLCLHAPTLASRSVLMTTPEEQPELEALLRARQGWAVSKPWRAGAMANRLDLLLEFPPE